MQSEVKFAPILQLATLTAAEERNPGFKLQEAYCLREEMAGCNGGEQGIGRPGECAQVGGSEGSETSLPTSKLGPGVRKKEGFQRWGMRPWLNMEL